MSAETDRITSVETAISHVLDAEQEALARIAACEGRADRKLHDARQAVREMVRRTQRRISRLHAGCAERTRELVSQMEREAAAGGDRALPGDEERAVLQRAVQAVARELTTLESPDAR